MAGVGRLLVGPGALRPRAKDQPASLSSHAGLNKGEASNSVRRAVFFHHQGEIRDRPDQQDIQIIR
jgi:TnpA family transposase